MSGSKFERSLLAIVGSLFMSTIAIGTAVAPATASYAATTEVVTYA